MGGLLFFAAAGAYGRCVGGFGWTVVGSLAGVAGVVVAAVMFGAIPLGQSRRHARLALAAHGPQTPLKAEVSRHRHQGVQTGPGSHQVNQFIQTLSRRRHPRRRLGRARSSVAPRTQGTGTEGVYVSVRVPHQPRLVVSMPASITAMQDRASGSPRSLPASARATCAI
jgi:hypothetical protein